MGATIGAMVAGAATGSVVRPVDTVIGMAIGATLDGLAGKGPSENSDPTAFGRHEAQQLELVEPELANAWNTMRGASDLSWDRARPAVKDAWQRVADLQGLGKGEALVTS